MVTLASALLFAGLVVLTNVLLSKQWFLAISACIWLGLGLESQLALIRVRLIQPERDQRARKIARWIEVEDLSSGDLPEEFGLYLRPFGLTGKLEVGGVDLETAFAYALAPFLPLIALGRPGEAIGAGRIQTRDEMWQADILRLLDAASFILLIPSHRQGTLWEIDRLKERCLFGKTILVMPPELRIEDCRYSEIWSRAVKALDENGVYLPEHFSQGLLFQLDDRGRLLKHAPFGAETFLADLRGTGVGTDDQGDSFDYDETAFSGVGDTDFGAGGDD